MPITRRDFLRTSTAFIGLQAFLSRGWAEDAPPAPGTGFGALVPDPGGVFDLPAGFSYAVVSRANEPMDDGLNTPSAMDGMAAFAVGGGLIALVRNHELTPDNLNGGPFGKDNGLLAKIDRSRLYDAGIGDGTRPMLGGTTTVVWDPVAKKRVRQALSLGGTIRNCAGGPTPWNAWITCEENTLRPGGKSPVAKDHGFAFEVPASATPELVQAKPLEAMGRFNREAVAIDPRTGIVYQTEDAATGVLYRFIPVKPGDLAAGGRLQALRISGFAGDTANWEKSDVALGAEMPVEWVDVADPGDKTAEQARAKGAHRFTRGEGIAQGRDALWFCCTNGGPRNYGQVWKYVPSAKEGTPDEATAPGRISLFCQPDDNRLLESGDNIVVAPWGDLVVCEDNAHKTATKDQCLRGISRDGRPYLLGMNRLNDGELAGACFSPDGKTMFVNIMYPGLTLAITGPWPA